MTDIRDDDILRFPSREENQPRPKAILGEQLPLRKVLESLIHS
jgi:hypothetical protein